MGRLVVVSNRVSDPQRPAAGGLAVAVGETLRQTGGLWFGWSGQIADGESGQTGADLPLHIQRAGDVQIATVDLTPEDEQGYYLGYSNGVLWPVFHNRLDLADFDAGYVDRYRRVNRLIARKLLPLLRPDDVIWVHDYHLIPLASDLRALGVEQRIGFFLHIPLPPPLLLAAIPEHAWLMRSLFACDLLGFQSRTDLAHFARYAEVELGATQLDGDMFDLDGERVRARAFPIGLDVDEFTRLARGRDAGDTLQTMREQYARRKLLIGVDRLDYSKGLPQRVRAFRTLLLRYPEDRNSATLIQVAAPTREGVGAYSDLRREMDGLCGAINGDYGELDWMPVRYIHRSMARKRLPGLYRASNVALVTPLRDGMNLVAKEFVAAQDPADPGVLVLSRFAGAAEQLRDAILVNPYDTQTTADAIHRALHMPLDERRQRHSLLLAEISRHDARWWRREFLDALNAA